MLSVFVQSEYTICTKHTQKSCEGMFSTPSQPLLTFCAYSVFLNQSMVSCTKVFSTVSSLLKTQKV